MLSAGAHVVVIAVVPSARSGEPTAPRTDVADVVVLELSVAERSQEGALARPRDGADVPERVRARRAAPARAVVDRSVSDARTTLGAARPATEAPSTDTTPTAPDTPRELPSLDPERVASAWLSIGPSTPEADAAREERAIEQRLDADLHARAMTKAHVTRTAIELVRRSDGSYVHRGVGFTAVIRPDGSVQFEDRGHAELGARDAVQTDGSGAAVERRHDPELPDALAELVEPLAPILDPLTAISVDPNQVRAPDGTSALPELLTEPAGAIATIAPPGTAFGIGGTFDTQGAAMRAAGQDPNLAERLRFLEETEELRDRLTDAHAARERAAALSRLRARVRRIWAGSGPAADRRRALFALWDDASEDEVGRTARDAIERFVREELPEGSADAYSDGELEQLNASRVSAERFAPYR
ncbi:hypothetical protein DB32_004229 [Sandaracinus amylolyticus]|uniref:Uncharacterized protein n=1 Tax=Sandaracinus amylolyticus TaxID=927083 RepID=A0A0F6W4B9_9BACT|nr:hypothetical protein DB32_004229 [Sandaracinus amylolyticus]